MKLVNKTINCIKNMKTYEILLVILMVLYLVTGVSTPYALAPYVNNMFMNASLIALVIVLYLYGNPLLALFVAIVSFVFINRSKKVDPIIMKPSEDNKDTAMDKLNTHLKEKTLEEELVGQIVRNPVNIPGPSSYQPVLCQSHNATKV